MGIITNNALLSNLGPKVPVKINLVGNVISNVGTKVENYGINSIMVEVYSINFERIVQVQKELIDQGYYIISMCGGCFDNSTFIRVGKFIKEKK